MDVRQRTADSGQRTQSPNGREILHPNKKIDEEDRNTTANEVDYDVKQTMNKRSTYLA